MMTPEWKTRSLRPRVATAADLATFLDNVVPNSRPPYQFTADAPCHASKSGQSFHFGGHPQGGLVISCWSCLGPGNGPGTAREMVERIEDRWHVGLQVRWPNGKLRYTYAAQETLYAPPYALPGATPRPVGADGAPAQSQIRFHGTQGPEVFTLKDLQEAPVWFAGKGKAAWQYGPDGNIRGFRHSLRDEDGGLRTARHGGPAWWRNKRTGKRVPITVHPWSDMADLEARIARWRGGQWLRHQLRPSLALGGEADMPHPLDVMVIDLDYSPDDDPGGGGVVFRDALAEELVAAGAPMFGSTSGNGWHALVRQDADFLRVARENGTEVRYPKDPEEKISGAAAETFPAGAKRHVVIRWEKARANADTLETPIPVISKDWLRAALETARARAEGREETARDNAEQQQRTR